MNEKNLLEEAERKYPIGTVVRCLTEGTEETIESKLQWLFDDMIIQSESPCTRVYKNGKWATIVNQIDPMVEIQRQAKEKFPIGSTFNNTEGNRYVLLEDTETYKINGTSIWAHNGAGCLYSNGKWAYLVESNYKALQNKAWEVFKDVKKGDRYISTRGSELVATKNAFKTTGSKEESCYIECGPNFLWEIKDGKELYGTLLPKEEVKEKWIPKVGEWVVSLVDKGDYRKKGDVFQVLDVMGATIYYKEDVNGTIDTFKPAEPHEIPIPLTTGTVTYTNTNINLSIPKHLLEYKEPKVKPKSNSEEIKIQVKKSKTIKI